MWPNQCWVEVQYPPLTCWLNSCRCSLMNLPLAWYKKTPLQTHFHFKQNCPIEQRTSEATALRWRWKSKFYTPLELRYRAGRSEKHSSPQNVVLSVIWLCHYPKCFDSMIPPWSQAPHQSWDLLSFWRVLMASSMMQSGENPAVFDNNPSKDAIFSLTEASFSWKEATPKKIPNTTRLKKKREQLILPTYIYSFKEQQMLSQVIIT